MSVPTLNRVVGRIASSDTPVMRVRVRRFLAVLTDRAGTLSLPRSSLRSAGPVGFHAPGQDHPARLAPCPVSTQAAGAARQDYLLRSNLSRMALHHQRLLLRAVLGEQTAKHGPIAGAILITEHLDGDPAIWTHFNPYYLDG